MSHEDTWHVTSRDVQVDAGVGRILRAVRDSGLEDNTLVYFTSDHGGDWLQLGDQVGHGGKMMMMMMIVNFRGDITEYIAVAREMGRWREE